MPPIGGGAAAPSSAGASTTMHSEVVMSELTDAASTSAVRTTFSGSMMPASAAVVRHCAKPCRLHLSGLTTFATSPSRNKATH